MTTFAPRATRASAIAFPMPELPPVTMATFPCQVISSDMFALLPLRHLAVRKCAHLNTSGLPLASVSSRKLPHAGEAGERIRAAGASRGRLQARAAGAHTGAGAAAMGERANQCRPGQDETNGEQSTGVGDPKATQAIVEKVGAGNAEILRAIAAEKGVPVNPLLAVLEKLGELLSEIPGIHEKKAVELLELRAQLKKLSLP